MTAAGAAALALAGLGGGIAAAATSPLATPALKNGSKALTAKLIPVVVKGQPSPGKKAAGTFTGTLEKTNKVDYRLTFKGLSAQATGVTLIFGAPGKKSTQSMSLVAKTATSPAKGTVMLTAKEATALRSGKAYVSIQTAKDKAGALRGAIKA
jgi:hypothetical protein